MITIGALIILFGVFVGWVWFSTIQPDQVQSAPVNSDQDMPLISEKEEIKLLNWNVQFMAGKGYHFYYEGGQDKRPKSEDIRKTTKGVAKIIKEENPDIILLQEVDDGAKRTDHKDQLGELLDLLPDDYRAHSSAFYWKALFSPHPKILGSVGMKLSVISKYKIKSATRYQLALKPDNWFVRQFDLKRAVLEIIFPRKNEKDFHIFNTHLTAFAFGSDVRSHQVEEIHNILKETSKKDHPWIIGGDFNLEPPVQGNKSREKEVIKNLFDNYKAVPGYEEVKGPDAEKWYTYFSNEPEIKQPNKTIDYYFCSEDILLKNYYVRSRDTLKISDHLPIIAEIKI